MRVRRIGAQMRTESGGDCNGTSQLPYAYTDVIAQYRG